MKKYNLQSTMAEKFEFYSDRKKHAHMSCLTSYTPGAYRASQSGLSL